MSHPNMPKHLSSCTPSDFDKNRLEHAKNLKKKLDTQNIPCTLDIATSVARADADVMKAQSLIIAKEVSKELEEKS